MGVLNKQSINKQVWARSHHLPSHWWSFFLLSLKYSMMQSLDLFSSLTTFTFLVCSYSLVTPKFISQAYCAFWIPDQYIYLTSSLGYLVDIPDLTSTKTNGLPSLSNLKLHPTIQKSWHPWRLSLSLLTWNLLENPVFSTFKTNIKLNQFSPPPLLPPYFKLSSLFASSITPLWFKQRDQLKPMSHLSFAQNPPPPPPPHISLLCNPQIWQLCLYLTLFALYTLCLECSSLR